ncbi:MAG: hypothetical protein HY326_00490 [Chloroflexi bacterium]|nr:hypothetical protein [Chloroflexota bacterium]
MTSLLLILAAFLASGVEMVEALTIVLAVGVTRGWRSPLIGAGMAAVVLAAIVVLLGPALAFIPISVLRLVIGTLLLIFGLQWLRKAILRASGYKALHDEEAIYLREVAEARAAGQVARAGMDWYSFTLAFKGVFLEGLEVAFIVVAFGGTQGGGIPLAATGAALAFVIVGLAGLVIHRPLSQVPENTMKFAVGLMLTTFGIFWGAEGAGVAWPGSDLAILGLLLFLVLVSLMAVRLLQARRQQPVTATASVGAGVKP